MARATRHPGHRQPAGHQQVRGRFAGPFCFWGTSKREKVHTCDIWRGVQLQRRFVFHSFPYDIAIPGLCNPIHDVISLAGGQMILSSEQRKPAAEYRGVEMQ